MKNSDYQKNNGFINVKRFKNSIILNEHLKVYKCQNIHEKYYQNLKIGNFSKKIILVFLDIYKLFSILFHFSKT